MTAQLDPNRFSGKALTRRKAFPESEYDYLVFIDGMKVGQITSLWIGQIFTKTTPEIGTLCRRSGYDFALHFARFDRQKGLLMATVRSRKRQQKKSDSSFGQSRLRADILALAETMGNSQKSRIVENMKVVVESTSQFFTSIEGILPLSDQFASVNERLQDFQAYFEEANITEIVEDAGNFARRNPVEAFAWATTAGVLGYMYFNGGARASKNTSKKPARKSAPKRKLADTAGNPK